MEIGRVKPRNIEEEMKTSYLDYAMTIIVSRALPDVRDGLKPSQRRILYSMHQLGLTAGAKYRKSALVVGDVLGKYHPHGDAAVYDALVRLAQDFSLRYPLVDGQGNFGSIDGDSPAQMRYTECRLTKLAEQLLEDISKETVNFTDNYDASRKEPKVLPAAVPQLLINGAVGIAVGMATNIPPHNVGEVIDALIYLIDHPECEVKDLMRFIKGPDFPTGGFIYSWNDILNAYSTGRGRITTRAKCKIVEDKKGRFAIIVSEMTYQSNKAMIITKIADLVKNGKIQGIRDIRDESDKDGIRVVIELKKDAYPKKVLNKLYQLTDLQKNFGVNMLALEDGIQPKVMNIKEMLFLYFKHRMEVTVRRFQFDLKKAKERAHILEGLKHALDHIDEVITTIRNSKNKEVAHNNLIKKFSFTGLQASAILEMRLQTLAGLERQKIEDELKEKKMLIKKLEELLASEVLLKGEIKKEILLKKEQFKDERKTVLVKEGIGEFKSEDLIPNEATMITISRGGYIKRINPAVYRVQKRGGVGVLGASTKKDDVVSHLLMAETHSEIYFFTDLGKVYAVKAYEIYESSRTSRGVALPNFLALAPKERVTAILPIKNKDVSVSLFMATKKGVVKRLALKSLINIRKNGIQSIKLRDKDELQWVKDCQDEDDVILVSAKGQSIRFKAKSIRSMGRVASGVRGIRVGEGDYIVGMDIILEGAKTQESLLVLSENGYGKRTSLNQYKVQARGGSGIKTMKVTAKNGFIAHASVLDKNALDLDLIATSSHGQVIRVNIKSIPKLGRSTQGVKIMKLRLNDKVAQATKI